MARRPLIVLPVDFSVGTAATVAYVFDLAKKRGADVDLLSIVTPRGSGRPQVAGFRGVGSVVDHPNWRGLTDVVRSVQGEGVRVRTVTHRGEARRVIPAYAQVNTADLIVIDRGYGTSSLFGTAMECQKA